MQNINKEFPFWAEDQNTLLNKWSSSIDGLSPSQVNARIPKTISKSLSDGKFFQDVSLLIRQFKNPLMFLLIGAVIISSILGEISDAIIIVFIISSSGLLGFFQERSARNVVAKLQSLIALKCTVLRSGIAQEIITSQIIPGDILLFKAGDMVPADGRILEANELHANEAALTGESFPVRKEVCILPESTDLSKRTNCLWQGSNIISGTGKFLVARVGSETIFGQLSQSLNQANETTFEKNLNSFGLFLMKITLYLSSLILIINLSLHKSVFSSLLFALALAVGMAPELLPAISTIAMSAGADRLLIKKVIVKKLSSIQNLGQVNLLCTDKTGTITEGKMTISKITDFAGNENEFVKQLSIWNARYETGYANPIDDALKKLSLSGPQPAVQKIGEIPYDFLRKRISVFLKDDKGDLILVTKGAFKQILEVCDSVLERDGNITPIHLQRTIIEKNYSDYGEQGFRVIGVAYQKWNEKELSRLEVPVEKNMIFAGFILMDDPVKQGMIETLSELQSMHVQLKIISGDNRNVAKSMAIKLGIKNPVIMTGSDLKLMSAAALSLNVLETQIFAEIEPQQKEQIILALRNTFTVAYMGDGINDVAAINMADVGISVENAVDVAREAADIVLLEKDLAVLIDGIKEGRKTFTNTLKYILINTGSTFGNMFSVAIASVLLPFLPMLPMQILLTNFITDFPYLSVASDNVDDEQINRPGKWDIKMLRSYMIIFGIHSSFFDVLTFLLLFFYFKVNENHFQTAWFIESIVTELFILFVIRTRKKFFLSGPSRYLMILSGIAIFITLSLPYLPFANQMGLVPLPWYILLTLFLIIICYVYTADLIKIWYFKKHS